MEKLLPLIHPPIETYQGSSFILGIILAYENIANAYYNNYINLECNNTNDIHNISLEFANISWDNYRMSGIAEMNLYHIANIPQNKFVDFIKERIDQGNYIIIYCIDEYYLSYTSCYKKHHNSHDTYIYGYNESHFFILAYKNGKLQKIHVPFKEIEEGLFSLLSNHCDLSFCTFRPNHAINVQANLCQIKQEFCNYLHSIDSNTLPNNKIYGINTYDVLSNCIKSFFNANPKTGIDLRPFRLLWEHKKLMRNHLIKYSEIAFIEDNNSILLFDETEQTANMIFKLMIKYNITYNANLSKQALELIDVLKEKEVNYLEPLFK